MKYVSGQCIGGCDVNGPPLSMSDEIGISKTSAKRRRAAYKANFESLDQLPFDQVFSMAAFFIFWLRTLSQPLQVVQLGEHSLGKPFLEYTADEEGQVFA